MKKIKILKTYCKNQTLKTLVSNYIKMNKE